MECDWETILDAEGSDLQEAYNGAVWDAMSRDDEPQEIPLVEHQDVPHQPVVSDGPGIALSELN